MVAPTSHLFKLECRGVQRKHAVPQGANERHLGQAILSFILSFHTLICSVYCLYDFCQTATCRSSQLVRHVRLLVRLPTATPNNLMHLEVVSTCSLVISSMVCISRLHWSESASVEASDTDSLVCYTACCEGTEAQDNVLANICLLPILPSSIVSFL